MPVASETGTRRWHPHLNKSLLLAGTARAGNHPTMLAVTTGEQGLLPCLSHSEGPARGSLDQASKEARVPSSLGCPETHKRAPSNHLQEGLPGKLGRLFLEEKKKSSMFNHDLTTFLKARFNQKGKFCSLQKAFPILCPKVLLP